MKFINNDLSNCNNKVIIIYKNATPATNCKMLVVIMLFEILTWKFNRVTNKDSFIL